MIAQTLAGTMLPRMATISKCGFHSHATPANVLPAVVLMADEKVEAKFIDFGGEVGNVG